MPVRRFQRTVYTPAKMCGCCNRLLAFPKLYTDRPGRVAIYLTSWHGDPFYDPKENVRHFYNKSRKRFIEENKPVPVEEMPELLK